MPDSIAGTDTPGNCSLGTLNEGSGAFAPFATYLNKILLIANPYSYTFPFWLNQGAYNTGDNCYYIFKTNTDTLYKIDRSGTVTALSGPLGATYSSLVYNKGTHLLYCFQHTATSIMLVSLSTSGTTFAVTALVAPVHPIAGDATVDSVTSSVFYTTHDTGSIAPSHYFVEKYQPGATASEVITFSSVAQDFSLYGLCFNTNDHMLYAIGTSGAITDVF